MTQCKIVFDLLFSVLSFFLSFSIENDLRNLFFFSFAHFMLTISYYHKIFMFRLKIYIFCWFRFDGNPLVTNRLPFDNEHFDCFRIWQFGYVSTALFCNLKNTFTLMLFQWLMMIEKHFSEFVNKSIRPWYGFVIWIRFHFLFFVWNFYFMD